MLGTYYGGNGTTPRVIGEVCGTENVTATLNNLPNHTHALGGITASTTLQLANPASNPANIPTATNSFIGTSGTGPGAANIYFDQVGASPVPLKSVTTTVSGTVAQTGNGLPMEIMNPFLAINFSIALNGLFPFRY